MRLLRFLNKRTGAQKDVPAPAEALPINPATHVPAGDQYEISALGISGAISVVLPPKLISNPGITGVGDIDQVLTIVPHFLGADTYEYAWYDSDGAALGVTTVTLTITLALAGKTVHGRVRAFKGATPTRWFSTDPVKIAPRDWDISGSNINTAPTFQPPVVSGSMIIG